MVEVMAVGNAGFKVRTQWHNIYIDAFYHPIPLVAAKSAIRYKDVQIADLILVTHDHPDHFDVDAVIDVARRTNAKVIGPEPVVNILRGKLSNELLIEMEPKAASKGKSASSLTKEISGIKVSAFRTFHGKAHNSYLVEMEGLRFFDDGDNEDTRPIPIEALTQLEALFIAPWKGSGWVEFIEKIAPPRYFIMHLTDKEITENDRGEFFSAICDRVPKGLIVLRPGESYQFEPASGVT